MAVAAVIRAVCCSPDDVRAVFDAVPLAKVQIGGDDWQAIMERGTCFAIIADGQTVGAYVLEAHGAELWVSAAAGRAGFDLTQALAALLDEQAAGWYDSIGFQTRRRGLMMKAARLGYQPERPGMPMTMRKKL
jgi:hypothetical protein